MNDILRMGKEEILALDPAAVSRLLTADEVVGMATVLGAFWKYDYEAAELGRVGMHALLKSGRHSDGFFVSKILLGPENIRCILSQQLVMRLRDTNVPTPNYVAGVPDGATVLGTTVAEMLGAREARMEKVDGRILLTTDIPEGATMLLVEDVCTRGTGFAEAVLQVRSRQPSVKLLPYDPVILNRGGLQEIALEGIGTFRVLPVVERRIQDWDPTDYCPLCARGSTAIKPKATDENWLLLTTSQRQHT